MRVAYFDLAFSIEQYGLAPTRYGGGGVAARHLKEEADIDFHVYAAAEAFDNVGPTERRDRCTVLASELCQALRNGYPLDIIMGPGKPYALPDIVLHGHTCFTLNRSASFGPPIAHWSGFDGSAGHPGNDYVLLYDSSFKPAFGERAKYVRIGKPVPAEFVEHQKEPFVFTCSRHDDHMNSIELAKECLRTGIKGVFAGPIHNGYPLLDHIDGKTTVYLGEIDEETKLDYHRRAQLFGLLANWDLPFNQSIIEAQGQGTPIYVNRRGPFLQTYLQHDLNGFNAALCSLEQAFESAQKVGYSRACWEAAREYDVSVMVASFKRAFCEIVEEWKTR